ncbi:hypothetical protein ABTH93_20630, partial [Acinetobacter baumannii]
MGQKETRSEIDLSEQVFWPIAVELSGSSTFCTANGLQNRWGIPKIAPMTIRTLIDLTHHEPPLSADGKLSAQE